MYDITIQDTINKTIFTQHFNSAFLMQKRLNKLKYSTKLRVLSHSYIDWRK